ncbi:MAG: hypothetical protein AOA65_1685 [Candidatus Bathyarchaeota archaeon BA1]|nr:MAG: hypothetical protein AOA65_1685 [Candidatus Bathyarchaeota archaeon BA1]
MELFRSIGCEVYIGPEPKIPALKVEARETVFERRKALIVPIDTGFAGYLLAPQDIYIELGTLELPREEFGVYTTLAGPIVLRRAEIKLSIKDEEIDTYIETPIFGAGKLLLGRRILSELNIALIGKKSLCCYLKPA